MDLKALEELAEKLKVARDNEYELTKSVILASRTLENAKVEVVELAHANGEIDSSMKVAQIKTAEEYILNNSPAIDNAVKELQMHKDAQSAAINVRKYLEDLVSLTKAWLYSQKEE